MQKPAFNTSGFPLAHLITFRCYGTWLPGDFRGTITKHHNRFGSFYLPEDPEWEKESSDLLKSDPVRLSRYMRKCVGKSIRETCEYFNWPLLALNIRTNHVHIVVSIGTYSAQKALAKFKSYATRDLRHDELWEEEHSPWTLKGSTRYLWNDEAVDAAIDYVVNGQGGDLPEGI
ncbi:MAG: transposase [Aridibacter famidurans]|nr:transposase [Aridibacter famidurans]